MEPRQRRFLVVELERPGSFGVYTLVIGEEDDGFHLCGYYVNGRRERCAVLTPDEVDAWALVGTEDCIVRRDVIVDSAVLCPVHPPYVVTDCCHDTLERVLYHRIH